VTELPFSRQVEIVQLLSSPIHRHEGRPADGPVPTDEVETRDVVEVRAGLGIVGDRHFGQRAHLQATVTLQAAESLEALASELGLESAPGLEQTRRNILLRGVDIDALVGAEFELDSGDGPVRIRAHRPANPCAWMDVRIAPGSHRGLRRRGGVRAEPLTDGILRVGPATLRASIPLADAPAAARPTLLF
jgi:MOSC domain-containing protein YiiM